MSMYSVLPCWRSPAGNLKDLKFFKALSWDEMCSLTLWIGEQCGPIPPLFRMVSAAGPELSLSTSLLARKAVGLMHGLSSGQHHLCAVTSCRPKADSKAFQLRSTALSRNPPVKDVALYLFSFGPHSALPQIPYPACLDWRSVWCLLKKKKPKTKNQDNKILFFCFVLFRCFFLVSGSL